MVVGTSEVPARLREAALLAGPAVVAAEAVPATYSC